MRHYSKGMMASIRLLVRRPAEGSRYTSTWYKRTVTPVIAWHRHGGLPQRRIIGVVGALWQLRLLHPFRLALYQNRTSASV